MPPVICNTTPLVALWELQGLPLLRDLFGEIIVPPAVNAEFLAAETEARLSALAQSPGISLQSLTNPIHTRAYADLD